MLETAIITAKYTLATTLLVAVFILGQRVGVPAIVAGLERMLTNAAEAK